MKFFLSAKCQCNCRDNCRFGIEWGFVITINNLLLGAHAKIIQDLNGYVIAGIPNSTTSTIDGALVFLS
jgi:hypothetical protein